MANKTLLWVGLAGIGGIAFYEWWKHRQTSGSVAPSGIAPIVPATTPPNAFLPVPQGGSVAPSASATAPAAPGVPAGIDPTVYSTVQGWATEDGRAPVLNMAAANIPSEYNGMYNIIANFWNKGIAPDANAVTFWNALRTKYDPTHSIW